MKNRILEVAERKFFKYGYSNVKVDDIVKELGISKKTIYNYFKGKDDILLKLIDKMKSDFEEEISNIENNTELEYIELVHNILKALGEWVSKISLFTADLKINHPEGYQKLSTYKKDVAIQYSTKILDLGVKKRYLRPDSETQIAMFMFLATAEKLIDDDYHKSLPKEMTEAFPKEQSERFRSIVNILYKGLKANFMFSF